MPPEFNVFNEHCYGMNKENWSVPTGDVTKYELWASQSSDFSFPWLYYTGLATLAWLLKIEHCAASKSTLFDDLIQCQYR